MTLPRLARVWVPAGEVRVGDVLLVDVDPDGAWQTYARVVDRLAFGPRHVNLAGVSPDGRRKEGEVEVGWDLAVVRPVPDASGAP